MARNILKIFQGLTGNIVIICGLIFAFLIPTIIDSDQNVPEVNTSKAYWTDFEPNKIPSYIEEGKPKYKGFIPDLLKFVLDFINRNFQNSKIIKEPKQNKNDPKVQSYSW